MRRRDTDGHEPEPPRAPRPTIGQPTALSRGMIVLAAFVVAVLALFAYASIEPESIPFVRPPEPNQARQEVATNPTTTPPAAPAPEAVALGVPLDDAVPVAAITPGEDAPAPLPEMTEGFVFASADPIMQAFAPTSLVLRLRTPSTRPPTTEPPPPTTPPPTTPPPTTPPPTEPPPTTPPPTEPPPTTPPPTEPPPTEPPPTEPPPTEPPPDDPLIVIDLPFLPDISLF